MSRDPPSAPPALLTLHDVAFRYPRDRTTHSTFWQRQKDPNRFRIDPDGALRPSLHAIRFQLRPGDRVVVVGPNGGGKSTLLQLCAGQRRASAGQLRLLDTFDPFEDGAAQRLIALVAEPWPTEAVFGCTVRGFLPDAAGPQAHAVATALHLRLGERVDGMSAGARRRVQLLRALLPPAVRVYLLDECSADLDVAERRGVLDRVAAEVGARAGVCLYATHILDGLQDWATHVLPIRDGRAGGLIPITRLGGLLERFVLRLMRADTQATAKLDDNNNNNNNNNNDRDDYNHLVSRIISDLVSGEPAEDDAEPFAPDRPPPGLPERWAKAVRTSRDYRPTPSSSHSNSTFTLNPPAEVVVQCEGLHFREVFADLNFSIYRGERVLLCGTNGSGKSTLLAILGGKQYFDNAKKHLRVLNKVCYAEDMQFSSEVAFAGGWWSRAPPGEVYVREMLSLTTPRAHALRELLNVNLDWEVGAISSGQLRRVQLLFFLLKDQPIVLLDEATADLDLHHRYELLKFLYLESVCRGVTVVYATHIFGGLRGWPSAVLLLDRTCRGVHAERHAVLGDAVDVSALSAEICALKSRETY